MLTCHTPALMTYGGSGHAHMPYFSTHNLWRLRSQLIVSVTQMLHTVVDVYRRKEGVEN